MSEVGVIAVRPQAYPNKDFPLAPGDAYFIRDHELHNALYKGLSKLPETAAELAAVAALPPTGYRVMPKVTIDNFDGTVMPPSNGWVTFDGDFMAGDIVAIHGIKWDPVDPANPVEFTAVDWGFNHVIAADGDGVVAAADVAASFAAQMNINSEALENRIRVFSSLIADGGNSPGFSMHRAYIVQPSSIIEDPETGEMTSWPISGAGSGKFFYVDHPDYPNTENQYEDKSVPVPPPANGGGTGGGNTSPPMSHGQKIGMDLDGDGTVDATYTKDS